MAFAGNPDRQGESGAAELLLNPWARSAGLHTLGTSFISGVEAMRLNVAGLSRLENTQILLGHTRYLDGADVLLNAAGIGTRITDNGVLGFSIMAMDFGDIPVTTTNQPEGTGAFYSPNFFHLGVSYAHMFENKVSVGATFRIISESTEDLRAQGIAIDAGVQYVSGDEDQFKFGISLRNIGTPMTFRGEGLVIRQTNPGEEIDFDLSFLQRAEKFELPSVLNIGASYDFILNPSHKITVVGNFTSNSFSRDNIGGGIEYHFAKILELRAGYRYELGVESNAVIDGQVYSGLGGGVTVNLPFNDEEGMIGFHYAYRATNIWNGTHNFTVSLDL